MRGGIFPGALVALMLLGACNTFGGIGKDLAEAGKAVENSADWSQGQINKADSQLRNN